MFVMNSIAHCCVTIAMVALCAGAGEDDAPLREVDRLTQLIREGGESAVRARAEVRNAMEKYFRAELIPLHAYALPFAKGRWKVTQGNSTVHSHSGVNQFSWDFELVDTAGLLHPLGFRSAERPKETYAYAKPIHAVAAGRVWLRGGALDGPGESNIIVIHHGDGTRAIYDHIRPDGFAVEASDQARRGQLIGYVGHSGVTYPHIHFSVRTDKLDSWTLPIRFERYFLFDPSTGRVDEVRNGVPLAGQIIAATAQEARRPSVPEEEPPRIPEEAKIFFHRRYCYFSHELDWMTARTVCARLGGQLVTITSHPEDRFVAGLLPRMGKFDRCWIGLTEAGHAGRWTWVTGEPFEYHNWADRQPDNMGGNQHHAQIGFAGKKRWSDGNGDTRHPFVCEWDSDAARRE